MAARTVRAFLHNETDRPLTRIEDRVESGKWAGDGRLRPPGTIAPHSKVEMGSDSSGFLPSGTEARVRFRIGDDPSAEVSLHWNNPFAGSNSYHQYTDPSHHVFRAGGTGNDAVVHFFLRSSSLRSTGFLPDRDGFRFPNRWPETPYSLPPLKGSVLDLKYGNARNGLCGGMVFAARDYFESEWTIPEPTQPPVGEEDPLFLYLVERLFDIFSVDTVSLMLKLMNPAYPDTDENVLAALSLASGRASVMANVEWPLIRADIDAGHPSPMVLIRVKSLLPWDLGQCHQVLAYAYQVRGDDVELHVYDPNHRGKNNVRLHFNVRTVAEPIVVRQVVEGDGTSFPPIYCFARMNYQHRRPTVVTSPRPQRPPVEVPRQFSLEVTEVNVLRETVVERGRKKFEVPPDCGEKEFDFERTKREERHSVTARAISYINPQIEWALNGMTIPLGAGNTLEVRPSPLGHAYVPQHSREPGADPPVRVKTSVDGLRLHIENEPADGRYSLTVEATCREKDDSEPPKRWSIGVNIRGTREIVPGLIEAADRCFKEYLDRLRQEGPSEEAIAASVYAQLGRPLDPIWDPDPDLLDTDWQAHLHDPDEALFVDGRETVAPENLVSIDLSQERVIVAPSSERDVVVIDVTGDDVMLPTPSGRGSVVINPTDHDVVLVDPAKHEAVTIIPAKQEVMLRVGPSNRILGGDQDFEG